MLKVLRSVKRTAWVAAFAAACVMFAAPGPAQAIGVPPVLSATAGDGQVELSWTEWNPPVDDALSNPVKEYGWRMMVEGDTDWSDWTYVSGTTTSTTVDDLENGKTHSFQIVGRERSWFVDQYVLRTSYLSGEAVVVVPQAPGE